MKAKKKRQHEVQNAVQENTSPKTAKLTVGQSAVTLIFPPEPHDTVLTEIKGMMLSGHGSATA